MRNIDACLYVRPSDRVTLERLLANGKTPQKIVARARIVLLSGRGFGTNAIQREARVFWRRQQAYLDGGAEHLLKDRRKGARAAGLPMKKGRAQTMTHGYKRIARRRCLRHSMSRLARLSASTCHVTAQRSSFAS
jgi:hypothetical protein